MNEITKIKIRSIKKLHKVLRKYEVRYGYWGERTTKDTDDLLREILSGESALYEIEGRLVRIVHAVEIDVRYRLSDSLHHQLIETHQVFKSGHRKKMNKLMSEKIKHGETHRQTAERGLSEELQIKGPFRLKFLGPMGLERTMSSRNFPGLITLHRKYCYIYWMPKRSYDPDGYNEPQEKKTTFFAWFPIPNEKLFSLKY